MPWCLSTNAAENPGDTAARYLLSRGRLKVDALILSHYHADHRNGVEELMRRMPVGMLIAPPPESKEAQELLDLASALGTSVRIVSEEVTEFSFGSLAASVTPPLGNVGDNEECLCALLRHGDYEVLTTGDASMETASAAGHRIADRRASRLRRVLRRSAAEGQRAGRSGDLRGPQQLRPALGGSLAASNVCRSRRLSHGSGRDR